MKNWCRMPSPIGELILVEENGELLEISFVNGRHAARPPADAHEDRAPFRDVIRQLQEYFSGTRRTFELPLAPRGTGFQRRVWSALLEIPFGRTVSYSDIATGIGNPQAVRAVGLANGRNPIPIIIPDRKSVV